MKILIDWLKQWNWYFIGALVTLALMWWGIYWVCNWVVTYLWRPEGVM